MPVALAGLRRAALGWLLVVAVAAGFAFLVATQAQAQTENVDAYADSLTRGALLYAQHCAQCHGADGLGGETPGMERYGGEAPALVQSVNPDVTPAYLDLVMSTGRMPPAGSPYDNRARRVEIDSEADREAIIDYIQREFGVEGDPIDFGEGDAAEGREVWATNCTHCHGATGAGGVAGAGAWTPQVSNRTPEEIAQAIRVGPFNMPAFEPEQISEEEIADVVAFMEQIREEPRTPVTNLFELNPVFAAAFVFVFALLMLVSLRWIGSKPAGFADEVPPVPSGARRKSDVPAGAPRDERATDPPERGAT